MKKSRIFISFFLIFFIMNNCKGQSKEKNIRNSENVIIDSNHLKEIDFYPNSEKKKEERIYINSKLDSVIGWYESGNLKSIFHIIKIDTILKFDSIYKEESEIIKVTREGKNYYENGKVSAERIVNTENNATILKKYNEQGILIKEEFYEKEKLIKVVNY